jgi:hypothetical protein
VWDWERNNFTNSVGLPVVHASLFRQLQEAFLALENDGIEVALWQCTRKSNRNAEVLAKLAFVEVAPEFSDESSQEFDWLDVD